MSMCLIWAFIEQDSSGFRALCCCFPEKSSGVLWKQLPVQIQQADVLWIFKIRVKHSCCFFRRWVSKCELYLYSDRILQETENVQSWKRLLKLFWRLVCSHSTSGEKFKAAAVLQFLQKSHQDTSVSVKTTPCRNISVKVSANNNESIKMCFNRPIIEEEKL